MPFLRCLKDGARIPLPGRCVVGRGAASGVHIEEPFVSSEHALLRFRAGRWTLRDLGSRNGTWLDGARVGPRVAEVVNEGAVIAFGDAACTWIFEDARAPAAFAVRHGGHDVRVAEGGLLALPDGANPRAVLFEARQGSWVAEVDGEPRSVKDGSVLTVGDEAWSVHLPASESSTMDVACRPPTLAEGSLRFCVDATEEHVEVTLETGGRSIPLPPRSHHYGLLLLARERLKSAGGGALSPHEEGWVSVDALCRMLAVEETNLNTQIYRIRLDFTGIGCVDAADVIERRRGKRMVRLGVSRVQIVLRDTA